MLRSVLSFLVGVIVACLVVAVVESLGHTLFPPPPGIDITKPESMAQVMSQIPFGAKLAVVIAWALGSLAGGFAAAKYARQHHVVVALLVGAVLLAFGAYSLFTIPHPLWMAALGMLVPLPMAWCGAKVATAKPRAAA
jgi:hypothetical protein